MNGVQKYHPFKVSLLSAALILILYKFWWESYIVETPNNVSHLPLFITVCASLILGSGLSALGWLLMQTKGQIAATFRPTQGRIISTISLVLVTPWGIISYIPFIVAGLLPLFLDNNGSNPLVFVTIVATVLAAYPISAMIVRHTYKRRILRLALFSLYFWTVYSFFLLKNGNIRFEIYV